MEREDLISSSAPGTPSTETSGRDLNLNWGTTPRPYQRKVRPTLTRMEAVLVREILDELARHPDSSQYLGFTGKGEINRIRRTLTKVDDAIKRRDRAQAIKEGKVDRFGTDLTKTNPADQPLF